MIDFILMCFDVAWFWFGRGVGAMLMMAFVVGIIASIVDYFFTKVKNIRLFMEFLRWKRNQ